MKLLREDELPTGFTYPRAFLRAVERGLTHLEPWWVFDGDNLRSRARGLRARFPDRALVPFARREDNDDVACWERRGVYPDFYAWLRQAVEDMIENDQQEDQ